MTVAINVTLAGRPIVQLKTCSAFAMITSNGIFTVVATSTFIVLFTFIYVCVENI